MLSSLTRTSLIPYGFALGTVLLAALLRWVLDPLWDARLPFFTFFPAVVLSAWWGGVPAGLTATLASAAAVDFMWMAPRAGVGPHDAGEVLALAMFVAIGAGITAVNEAARRARRRVDDARAEAEATAALLTKLQQVTEDVPPTLSLQEVLHALLRRLREVLDADSAQVLLLDDAGERLVPAAADSLPGPETAAGAPEERGLTGRIAASEDGLIVSAPDAGEATGGRREEAARSVLGVPLRLDGELIGVMEVGARTPGRFTPADLDLLRRVGRRAVLAIERARLAVEQARARAEAEAANRAKDDFLAVLSHELRTPLTSMLGWVRMLRSHQLPPERSEHALEVIERNTRTQAQLINDLLDVSRIVAGKMEVAHEPLDLGTVVVRAVDAARREAQARGIVLDVVVASGAGTVMGDATRLEQVVTNLVGNALKFTPATGRVQVRLERVAGEVRLTVHDSGQGIAPEVLPHVFDRFRQGEGSSRRRHEGLGLGLAIVRHLVEAHGGRVAARSAGEGRGATFEVFLPVGGAPGRAAAPGQPGAEASRLDGVSVLLVEDHADSLEVLTAALATRGAEVMPVASVAEALSALRARGVDVLVSDLGLPGADGFDLISRVRADERRGRRPRRLPAVAVTAFVGPEDRTRALRAGYDVHLAKPIDPAELSAAVARLTGRAA